MKNLSTKLLNYLEENSQIIPNKCQIEVASKIDYVISTHSKFSFLNFSKDFKIGVYIFGSVGVGKSVVLKALNDLFPESKMMHFNELIFNLQSKKENKIKLNKNFNKKRLILIDEFFIDNLTSLILFKDFLMEMQKLKIPIIMSGNKKLPFIYDDPVNPILCKKVRKMLERLFLSIRINSKVDYRQQYILNQKFFFINKKNANLKQNNIVREFSSSSLPKTMSFKRKGNSFKLDKTYGNLIDFDFSQFFIKNLIFQDYEIISKKIKFFLIRNIHQMNENSKNLLARFISFVDVLYENKNILSVSTNVELDNLYTGKTNSIEFKRTVSRLKEMGSNTYININLKKL